MTKVETLIVSQAQVTEVITTLSVRYWPDTAGSQVFIQANDCPPYKMHRAVVSDFT